MDLVAFRKNKGVTKAWKRPQKIQFYLVSSPVGCHLPIGLVVARGLFQA